MYHFSHSTCSSIEEHTAALEHLYAACSQQNYDPETLLGIWTYIERLHWQMKNSIEAKELDMDTGCKTAGASF